MTRARHDKNGWTVPRPGTKIHGIIKMLLRDQGATPEELYRHGLLTRTGQTSYIASMEDQFGYIVRTFPCPPERRSRRTSRRGPPEVLHKIVGRYRWDAKGVDDYTVAGFSPAAG